ncbi:hypothetical protein EPN90_02780 [Patescibacteria group bacterium]|nr:MAG: hypothetical protein EPN90_02780 [Patescibacteria group bacterium]
MSNLSWRTASLALFGTLVVYLISFLGSRNTLAEIIWLSAILIITAFGRWRSLIFVTSLVVVELVAGSLGRLFAFPSGLSLREGLFAIALLATLLRLWRNPDELAYLRQHILKWPFLFLAAVIIWGILRGLTLHPFRLVIADANAYGYFLLLPAFLLAYREEKNRELLFSTILGATTAAALLTLFELYIFTHGWNEPFLGAQYKWVRDFGLGEITRAPGGFYRVFFQAHFWNFIVFIWSPALIVSHLGNIRANDSKVWWLFVPAALSAAALFVSFSRTFWLAAGLAALLGLAIVIARSDLRGAAFRYLGALIFISILGVAVPFAITRSVGGAAFSRAGALAGEAAADSRMNLLAVMAPVIREHPILGWGFGKELTYITKDPRLLAYFPDGRYTTYAFEWGWLDFWLKMGLGGMIAFLALVLTLLRGLWRGIAVADDRWLSLALFLSLVGVSVAHLFSPWLNHPLGIGLVLLIVALWQKTKSDPYIKKDSYF